MAAHTWTDGEAITASKLNAIERKKSFLIGELKITDLTYEEAVQLIEDIGCVDYSYGYEDGMYQITNHLLHKTYFANTSTSILTVNTAGR